MSDFRLGDIVETIRGAKFWGEIIAIDNDGNSPGCTVLAVDPGFAGTKHAYPLKQLAHRAPSPSPAPGAVEKALRFYAEYFETEALGDLARTALASLSQPAKGEDRPHEFTSDPNRPGTCFACGRHYDARIHDTPANPAQGASGLADRLQSAIDGLGRHGVLGIAPVMREAVEFIRSAAIATAPKPPGWPDPLESPQAEAIRNGKLDDTEIQNLFDSMERELRLHRERAANPAQVTDAMVAEAAKSLGHEGVYVSYETTRRALTAAIGAGGQAVARPVAWQNIETPSSILTPDQYEMRLPLAKGRFLPLYTHPAPSGQAVAVESYNFPRTIAEAREALEGINEWLGQRQSGEATTNSEAAIFQRVHSALQNIDAFALADLSNPLAQPGWRMVPEAALDWLFGEGPDANGQWFGDVRGKGAFWWRKQFRAMLSAAPLPGGAK